MKKLHFKSAVVVGVPFNTNNAWGFGGGFGIEHTFPNGYKCREGTACYRHLRSEKFRTFITPDGMRVTESEALPAIKEYLT